MTDITALLADLDPAAPSYMAEGIARLQSSLPLTDPGDLEAYLTLLGRLYGAGRVDLPLARLFEGHMDALQIVARYGDAQSARHLHGSARNGARFGVWNAPLAGEPLRLHSGMIDGGKAFASGAGLLTHALVSADVDDCQHKQLLVIDLQHTPPVIDRNWWQVLGMQRSETHLVRWQNAPLGAGDMPIGAPGDYEREPWLSAGALRFVAAQAGGIAGLFDGVRAHLVARNRAGDPHQAARLGRLYGLADNAAAVCRSTAAALFDTPTDSHPARVASARSTVLEAGEQAILLAQQSVGLSAFFETDPLCAHMADLMVYLRQPAPDAQRVKVGAAAASQSIELSL
ncbi:acyl-CoA dehydrogenase, exported protein [Salinisphaera dokdonensis CL-ES53]|uniref:Acyl-CoA dehydrogenase, exported protein n=1 Tax=Salinisphaera dokdonensis CL-ES53 TaxID=1304272 RepID=A0ABV2B260_9GAMM